MPTEQRVKAWLHMSSAFGVFAHPVWLLASGPKRSVVRLRWRMRWRRRDIPAGTVRHVPTPCVSDAPWSHALVGVRACVFEPPMQADAIRMVKEWHSVPNPKKRKAVRRG